MRAAPQRSRRRVGSHARRAAGGVDVTRTLRRRVRQTRGNPGIDERSEHHGYRGPEAAEFPLFPRACFHVVSHLCHGCDSKGVSANARRQTVTQSPASVKQS